jgi:GNAT superfamily N-acetyltransferase
VNLVSADDLDDDQLEQVRAIYEGAFEAELRTPMDDLRRDQMLVLLEEATPCGFAVLRALGPTGWVYLRYLAAGTRGQGRGSALWAHLGQAMTEAGYTRIIWDVEDPDEPGTDPAEVLIRTRRIGFYTRLGAHLLPVHGYQMPLEADNHPMRLMASDLKAGPVMVGDELRAMVIATYRYRYGLGEADPLVQETLRASGLEPTPAP